MGSPTYALGSQVKVTVNELPYMGTVITYNDADDPTIYTVSVAGLGDCLVVDEDSLESLTDGNEG